MNNKIYYTKIKINSYYINNRDEMHRFIPEKINNILEVGCGTGIFGKNLKSKRNNIGVWGIEISKSAAEAAKTRLDKVIIADIENDSIDLPKKYFDCIVFNDVLEHLKYPCAVLKKIADYLIDDGCVVASIPNVRYFYNIKELLKNKEWRYEGSGILDKTHLRFFTIKSIKEMFESCDYHLVKVEGINPIKFPWKFRLLNWLLMKKFEDMRFVQFACVAKKKTDSK